MREETPFLAIAAFTVAAPACTLALVANATVAYAWVAACIGVTALAYFRATR